MKNSKGLYVPPDFDVMRHIYDEWFGSEYRRRDGVCISEKPRQNDITKERGTNGDLLQRV